MASSGALRRLRKEYEALRKEPPPGAVVEPLETNFLHAHFVLFGSVFWDTAYEGGVYHGVLKFPSNYPLAPPTVIMRTPSGRFQVDKKICFSLSDFHPELWNPMWSTRTIITGLVSFMNSDEITTGGMEAPASHRVDLARKSLSHCLAHSSGSLFAETLGKISEERRGLSSEGDWPPPRSEACVEAPPPEVASKRQGRSSRRGGRSTQENVVDDAVAGKTPPVPSSLTPPGTGKNAAKNKKKKERERRKKAAHRFVGNLREQVPRFFASIQQHLAERYEMDVSGYQADHVCWRTESQEEYEQLKSSLCSVGDECELLIESEIGGRLISTFRLATPLDCGDCRSIEVIEIPSPKNGRAYRSGLEHVEFVIGNGIAGVSPLSDEQHLDAFDNLMKKYPEVNWSEKAKEKKINPDVSIKVEIEDFGHCSVKFHLIPLADVIKYELTGKLMS